MRTSILNTEFNFAKSINISLIAAPDAYPHFEQGISNFIKPYLQELQENTLIPEYLTLVSIQTLDQDEQGIHILTFSIKDPENLSEDSETQKLILKTLKETFAYDPDACFNSQPQVNQWESHFTVIIPYTC